MGFGGGTVSGFLGSGIRLGGPTGGNGAEIRGLSGTGKISGRRETRTLDGKLFGTGGPFKGGFLMGGPLCFGKIPGPGLFFPHENLGPR